MLKSTILKQGRHKVMRKETHSIRRLAACIPALLLAALIALTGCNEGGRNDYPVREVIMAKSDDCQVLPRGEPDTPSSSTNADEGGLDTTETLILIGSMFL